jgi:hypothetical protein
VDVGDAAVSLSPGIFAAVSLVPFPPARKAPAKNPQFVGAQSTLVNPSAEERAARIAQPPLVVQDLGDDDAPDE